MSSQLEQMHQELTMPDNWLAIASEKSQKKLSAKEALKKLRQIEAAAPSPYRATPIKFLDESYDAMAAMFQHDHLYYAFRVGKILLNGPESPVLREKICTGLLHIMAAYAQKDGMDQFDTVLANFSANQALRETKIEKTTSELGDAQHYMLGAMLVIGGNSLKNCPDLSVCQTIADSALYARQILVARGENVSTACTNCNNLLVDTAAVCMDLPAHEGEESAANTLEHLVRSYDVHAMSEPHFAMIPGLINRLPPELIQKYHLQRFQNSSDVVQKPAADDQSYLLRPLELKRILNIG